MSWVFSVDGTPNNSVNTAPATGARALWTLVSCLLQAGWTKKADSDGTTYSSTGVQVTSGASGAGGLGNTSAWVRLQDPAGVRELCFQRGTTNLLWRVKWSHSAKFTGGSPGAAQTPSATDEQIVNSVGGGTNASPTYTSIFSADNAYKFHCGADNATPYDWWWFAVDNTSAANPRKGWFLNFLTGTFPTEDVAPYIVDFGGTSSPLGTTQIWGSSYYKKGLAGEAWGALYVLVYYSNRAATQQCPGGVGQVANPFNGRRDSLPVMFMRDGGLAQVGYRGMANMDSVLFGFTTHSAGDFYESVDTSKRWQAIASTSLLFRWPTGVAQTL